MQGGDRQIVTKSKDRRPRRDDARHAQRGSPRRVFPPVDVKPGPLSREWTVELGETARPSLLQKGKSLVASALERFLQDEFEAAAARAEEAKQVAPRSSRIRELLGLAYYRSARWHDAARELLTYRRLTGRKDQNHVIADCYRALGRFERALEVCREVSRDEVAPDIWAEVLIVSASSLGEMGELPRALAEIARADLEPRKVDEHTLRLWYVRADLLERAGDRGQANRLWERIYAEDPGFFDVEERLG